MGNSNCQLDIIGYEVCNGVEVNVCDFGKFGGLLMFVVESGVNLVDGICFDVSDLDQFLDEVCKQVVEVVCYKVEIFVFVVGVMFGNILVILEIGVQMFWLVMMWVEMMMVSVDVVLIEVGEEIISVLVIICW